MPRIVKTPEERKQELMLAALKLFEVQGYEATTVDNIVEVVGVAKGTFYYYFDSKSTILFELFRAYLMQFESIFIDIQKNPTLTAPLKLQMILQSMIGSENKDDKRQVQFTYSPINIVNFLRNDTSALVLKTFSKVAKDIYLPILRKIIEEGNEIGSFDTEYPTETIELLLEIMRYLAEFISSQKSKKLKRMIQAANNIFRKSLGSKDEILIIPF